MATDTSALGRQLGEETLTLREHLYTVRELPFNEYDKLVKASKRKIPMPDGSVVDGEQDDDMLGMLLLNKAVDSVVPPLGDGGVMAEGTRVVIALRTVVNRLHYGAVNKSALDTELDATAAAQAASEDKAKGKG